MLQYGTSVNISPYIVKGTGEGLGVAVCVAVGCGVAVGEILLNEQAKRGKAITIIKRHILACISKRFLLIYSLVKIICSLPKSHLKALNLNISDDPRAA